MKYVVKAQRTEYQEFMLVLPDDEVPTAQILAEAINAGQGASTDQVFTSWLPTHVDACQVRT